MILRGRKILYSLLSSELLAFSILSRDSPTLPCCCGQYRAVINHETGVPVALLIIYAPVPDAIALSGPKAKQRNRETPVNAALPGGKTSLQGRLSGASESTFDNEPIAP